MSFLSCAERAGLADGTVAHFEESIYLLDEQYTVIGQREASEPDAPVPAVGDRFFDHFQISPEERATLERMLRSLCCDSLLIRAGKRPVLMLCQFFARTRLLVAIVPQGEIRGCFEAPAAYADVLEELHVRLSGEAHILGEPLDAHRYAVLCEWLGRVHIPLFFEGYQRNKADADVATVATRLFHLALLCGCRLDYDLSGFGYDPLHVEDYDLLIGSAFALFLMARRTCRDREISMIGKRRFGAGPTLNVLVRCDATVDTLTEIGVLCREAATRNDLFGVYRDPNDTSLLYLQFSFQNKELSAQDLKEKLGFEGGCHTITVCTLTSEEIARAMQIDDPFPRPWDETEQKP